MDAASPPQQPLLQDRYRVAARLGLTRLAVVYRANDERLHRTVLVHALRPELQTQEQLRLRFIEEMQARAKMTHPALLELYDTGEAGGRPFYVTEDLVGKQLRELLPLPHDQALRIWRQVSGALLACQEAGVLAPPLASSTIIITENRRAEILEPWWLTPDELTLELAHYRAPERAQGQPPSPATPVYSLGILAYELFGGKRPITGGSAQALAQAHLNTQLPPPREFLAGFWPRLAQLLIWSTERNPTMRLPDLATLVREQSAVESAAEVPTQRLQRPARPLRESVREAVRPVTQRISGSTPAPDPVQTIPQQRQSIPAAPQQRQPLPPAAQPRPYVPPAAPPAAPPAPQPRPADIKKQVQQEVRREIRRQGCRRWIARRVVTVALLATLVGSCAWVVGFGLEWYRQGNAYAICMEQLPEFARGFACGLLPESTALIVQIDGVNLRAEPRIDAEVREVLAVGTRVQPIGDPISSADGIVWQQVEVSIDGRGDMIGYVARDYLADE